MNGKYQLQIIGKILGENPWWVILKPVSKKSKSVANKWALVKSNQRVIQQDFDTSMFLMPKQSYPKKFFYKF